MSQNMPDRTDSHRCSFALITMVPTAFSVVHRPSVSVSNAFKTVDEGHSTSSSFQSAVGWVKNIGQCYSAANISESTQNILLLALRKHTILANSSAWP